MLAQLGKWINERWPLNALMRLVLEEDIPGGSSFFYTLGSALIIVFTIQAVTGVWQLFYYVPTIDHAYDSLNYLVMNVPFGWLIHGLHFWGANAMVVLIVLHMARVFIWGAYKSPREVTWLAGVVLLLLTLGLSFTGSPLPWNEKGFWAAEVGTSIAGTVPFVGEFTKTLMRGGETMGQLALSRMFITHVAILPALLVGFIGIHVIALRQFGSVGPWDEKKRKRTQPFWPDQMFKDAIIATLLVLLLVGLAAFYPPPVEGPADPLDTSFLPKPEWNFLFLYQVIKFFPGKLEALGTVGIPLVGILVMALLPFLDRNPQRSPLRRPLAIGGGFIVAVVVSWLTIAGAYSHPGATVAGKPPAPSGILAKLSPSAREGQKVFQTLGCIGCHTINGTGGSVGPDLSDEAVKGRKRLWLVTQIKDPKSHNAASTMPSYGTLGDQQMGELVDYLLSQGSGGGAPATGKPETPAKPSAPPVKAKAPTPPPAAPAAAPHPAKPEKPAHVPPSLAVQGPPGPAASIIGSANHGQILYTQNCMSCHGPQAAGNIPNPGSETGKTPPLVIIDKSLYSSDPQVFAENVDRILQHGLAPTGAAQQLSMHAFGDASSLTQPQIADLEAYVMALNGVDRGKLAHPGIRPRLFFIGTVALFALAWIWIALARALARR